MQNIRITFYTKICLFLLQLTKSLSTLGFEQFLVHCFVHLKEEGSSLPLLLVDSRFIKTYKSVLAVCQAFLYSNTSTGPFTK